MFFGAVGGKPYKVYAVQAAATGVPFSTFLLFSIPARLFRFLLLTGVAAGLARLTPRLSLRARRTIHLVLWTGGYVCNFWLLGG
jgi:hypothetical protein